MSEKIPYCAQYFCSVQWSFLLMNELIRVNVEGVLVDDLVFPSSTYKSVDRKVLCEKLHAV